MPRRPQLGPQLPNMVRTYLADIPTEEWVYNAGGGIWVADYPDEQAAIGAWFGSGELDKVASARAVIAAPSSFYVDLALKKMYINIGAAPIGTVEVWI